MTQTSSPRLSALNLNKLHGKTCINCSVFCPRASDWLRSGEDLKLCKKYFYRCSKDEERLSTPRSLTQYVNWPRTSQRSGRRQGYL